MFTVNATAESMSVRVAASCRRLRRRAMTPSKMLWKSWVTWVDTMMVRLSSAGLGEHPAECLFRSYVESVGRFVEQQHLCAECESDGDKRFASVAERQTVEAFAVG